MGSITEHQNDSCHLCKMAGLQQTDHYALGGLRHRLANSLGLTYASSITIPFGELLAKHAEAGHPALGR